jgi:putative endonuclease
MIALYVLQSEASGRYYVGSTSDLDRRLEEHRRNHTPSTRGRGPWKLVHLEEFPVLLSARRRERQIKGWKSHLKIQQLVAGKPPG